MTHEGRRVEDIDEANRIIEVLISDVKAQYLYKCLFGCGCLVLSVLLIGVLLILMETVHG